MFYTTCVQLTPRAYWDECCVPSPALIASLQNNGSLELLIKWILLLWMLLTTKWRVWRWEDCYVPLLWY